MMGLAPLGAHAAWPEDKPIRMIVPYTAGGASDTLGRMIAARLTESLKQTVVVENKPGAGSMLGSQYVARAEPDRSEEHTSQLQSLMRISYAVFCLKKKTH